MTATLPTRYVFDEGHHVFDAADSAFSLALTGREAAELRRWLLGDEDRGRGRARGLRRRLEDLVAGDDAAERALAAVVVGARVLPGEGWRAAPRRGSPAAGEPRRSWRSCASRCWRAPSRQRAGLQPRDRAAAADRRRSSPPARALALALETISMRRCGFSPSG